MWAFRGFRWLDLLAVLAMFAVAFYALGRLPERVPLHFGLDGRPDRFGSRDEAAFTLFFVPLVFGFVYALLRGLPRWDKRAAQNGPVLQQVSSVLAVFGAVLTGSIAQTMLTGTAYGLERLVLVGLGLTFAVLGSALPKTRPNLWVGIRLSYTLSSDLAWARVHRTGGWWLTLYGLALLLLSLVPLGGVALAGVLSLPVVTLLGLIALNARARRLWQQDPQRRPVR